MNVKARVSLALAALLGLSSWCVPARAEMPVIQQIPWTIKTPSFATGRFLVSRGLSYSSTGTPVAWSGQGTESFALGNATILLGKYKALTSLDFSKQMWLTIKAKKSDGTWADDREEPAGHPLVLQFNVERRSRPQHRRRYGRHRKRGNDRNFGYDLHQLDGRLLP